MIRLQGSATRCLSPLLNVMTDRLDRSARDKDYAAATDHSVLLTACESGFVQVMEAEARISRRCRDALQ